MNSLIFPSKSCSKCNERPFEEPERLVLKTATRDICCTCGSILQEYPAITGISVQSGQISLPKAVSAVLERLLTRRLFILDRGHQPRRVGRSDLNVERMAKTLVHRAGDQVYVTLRGPGNCHAEIRWNYSSAELLPPLPWDEMDYTDFRRPRKKTELKPNLQAVEFPLPPRIVRSCDAIEDFDLVSSHLDRRNRFSRSLRFERRVPVTETILDTTESLVLVVKVELSWLQVGSSFPSEEGPREFNISAFYQGYPQSLEEAVDLAIYQAMQGAGEQRGGDIEIHHSSDRLAKLAKVVNPLTLHRAPQHYYMSCRPVAQNKSEISCNNDDRWQGAFDTGSGVFLVPEELDCYFSVYMPQDRRYREEHILPDVQIVVKRGDNIVVDKTFGGPARDMGHGSWGNSVGYTVSDDGLKKFVDGETVTTSVTDNGATVERVYKVVSLKAYEDAWDASRNPVIERYKRTLIAEVSKLMREYWRTRREEQKPFELKGGQKAAAFIDGRWMEGVYEGTEDGDHVVNVVTASGHISYYASQVLPLEVALTEGLYVVPPFNPLNSTGTQAARREKPASK